MFEKVNPAHPDKVADRIAGALVDIAYTLTPLPRIAVEVMIGHGKCHIMAETSVSLPEKGVNEAVERIAGPGFTVDLVQVAQDERLACNQMRGLRCGDNGIFRGAPITSEQRELTKLAKELYFGCDGKMISSAGRLIICQSHLQKADADAMISDGFLPRYAEVNPLGYWEGGPDVDTGCTNRKLGSDMGDAVTGGGLHGKDLSKPDVSLNIFAHIIAQQTSEIIQYSCSIGDETIDGTPYADIVRVASRYVNEIGGFEKLAEWGLIR